MPYKKFDFIKNVLSEATPGSVFDVLIETNPKEKPHVLLRRVRLVITSVVRKKENSVDVNKHEIIISFVLVDLGLHDLCVGLWYDSFSDDTGDLKEFVHMKFRQGPFKQVFGVYDCQWLDAHKIKKLLDLSDSMVDRFLKYDEMMEYEEVEFWRQKQIHFADNGPNIWAVHEQTGILKRDFLENARYRLNTKIRTLELCRAAAYESIKEELEKTLNES